MDFASVLPPLLLAPEPHHAVLDMCAAPGGKSLVLALQLLKGTPAQQQQQQQQPEHGSSTAVGLTTALLEQLQLQKQHSLQDTDQQPEQQTLATQHEEHTGADVSEEQQQQNVPAAETSEADGNHSSSDAGSDAGEVDDTAASVTAAFAGHASGAQQPGRLICNELDPIRRQRLAGVLAAYLPGSLRRRVRLTGQDASKHWATFEAGMYDRVLLDAPCSSERHVVQQAVQGGGVVPASSWSKEHCKQLAALQLKVSCAAQDESNNLQWAVLLVKLSLTMLRSLGAEQVDVQRHQMKLSPCAAEHTALAEQYPASALLLWQLQ
jgi:hypothetical protein